MNDLTARQKQVLDFLGGYQMRYGYPPTIRDIREAFGLKSNRGVVDHLNALERKGYIRRVSRSSRAIEILRPKGMQGGEVSDRGTVNYPVAGDIKAGEPALPVEDINDFILLDEKLFRQPGDFLLEVKGDSMIDDHIMPGDLLVVSRDPVCRSGDIVVALVDGEATVKRLIKRGDSIILKPSNKMYEPIVLNKDELETCRIVGTVLGVIRRYQAGRKTISG
ncbi:MAG: transcriptional repressor LexA [candidate division WOR-3 bacterium]|nr:MAG: transcriptional repressor LexA [candidate division WOR-3 bacterium]UCF06905.1 MAG: transcriptional repressor LexA [bacterium]